MLAAFQPQPVHELKPRDKSKIESLLAFGDRLLVGLNSGSLRIYRVNETSTPPTVEENGTNGDTASHDEPPQSPSKTKPVELLREEEKFSRRPVQQLAIIKEANLLVSLSDSYISLHDLQTYGLVERIERTKGAGYFTVTSNVVKDAETGVPSLVSRLAVAVKRKVLVWTWRDMELEENVVEMVTEASVKGLTWVSGKNEEGALQLRLVVGMDAGFTMVNAEKPEEDAKPVFKSASRQDTTSGELAGVRFGAVSSSGMGYMGMGSWVPKPMATALSDGQVLLAKDVNTLFTDLDGRPVEKRQVPWALAPEAIGFSYPYLLALQPPEKGTLQIRNPDTLSLLQTISVPSANILHVPQPNISLAHAGKGFLVASDRTIWRMNALPYPNQLEQLVERERFDEAISLLTLLEDTLIDGKLGRIREIKVQKASALFQQQKYRPALDLFTEAEAPPERVIKLYPRSIAGDLSSVPEPSTEEGEQTGSGGEDAPTKAEEPANKEPPSTPQKGVLSSFKRSHTRRESDTASIKSTPTAASRSPAAPEKEKDKPLEGDDLKFATRCLCSFLAQARVQIQKYLSTDGTLKQDPPELDPETNKPAFANLLPFSVFETDTDMKHVDWQQALLDTAKLVDTTLFRAYMLASPSLAGPLFRLDNFCDPEVVQSSLYENDRYGDLIDFLHGKKLHRQALEMLQKFGKGVSPGEAGDDARGGEGKSGALHTEAVPEELKGPDRTVAYLRQLPPELIEIILEFVRWPLEVAPEKGMEVFLADSDNAERMPRDRVVKYLAEMDEELETQYLEHVITELGDQTAEFHQRLVDLYLAALKTPRIDAEEREKVKLKLEDFLCKSKVYNKGSTFRQLPSEDPTLFESRAIVLSAMGNHKQALAIYVFQLNDYAKAEDYCNRIYLSQQSSQQQGEACLIDGTTTHPEKPSSGASSFFPPEDGSRDQPNVFAMLLGLYLRPPQSEEKRWPQALELLSRHGARLPASSTLDLMPDDLAVSELQSYFLNRIRHSTTILRQTSILKSLAAVQKVDTERQWMLGSDDVVEEGKKGGRNRRVRITEEDHCRVCHKRFGASAVRVYPDDTVVHYGCVGKRAAADVGGGTGGRRASRTRAWG